MGLKAKLIVGLADEEIGSRVADALQHVTGSSNALTVGATTVLVGVTGGSLGFFGSAVTARPSGVTLNNVTAVANALANLGLIATTS